MMRVADRIAVSPARAVTGVLRVPGDKSISHRYALLAAIADGPSTISNYAPGADCASTLTCLASLGAIVSRTPAPDDGDPPIVTVSGRGLRGLTSLWGWLRASGGLVLERALVLGGQSAFEYVLVHELCHLLHRNHSRRYWREVEKRWPQWRDERGYLHGEGLALKSELRRLTAK